MALVGVKIESFFFWKAAGVVSTILMCESFDPGYF